MEVIYSFPHYHFGTVEALFVLFQGKFRFVLPVLQTNQIKNLEAI